MNDQLPAVPRNDDDALLVMLDKWATDASVDPEKIRAFWEIRKEYRAELRAERAAEARRLFEKDLSEVTALIDNIKRSGRNPVFSSAYAKLEDLDAAARPVYTQYGISIRYSSILTDRTIPLPRDGWMRVVLIITHPSGHFEEHFMDGPMTGVGGGGRGPARTPMQEVGANDTYLRRYLLQRTLNLVPHGMPEDTDGEHQRGRPAYPPPPARPAQTPDAWIEELCQEIDGRMSIPEQVDALHRRTATMTPGQLEGFRNHPRWLAYLDRLMPPDAEALRRLLDERANPPPMQP